MKQSEAQKCNIIDSVLERHFPTLMVSQRGMEPGEEGKSRLLIASDGLYIDTNHPWGSLTRRLWHSPAPLPYGPVKEKDSFSSALQASLEILQREFLEPIIENAEKGTEWYGAIGWENGSFLPIATSLTADAASVRYQLLNEKNPPLFVADVHSHGCLPPYFSHADDGDDREGVKIAIVVGNCLSSNGIISVRWRYCVTRFLLETNNILMRRTSDGPK